MVLATLLLGAPQWLWPAVCLTAVSLALVVWSYVRSPASWTARLAAAALKSTGIIALALCLVEPLFSGVRPRPGANIWGVLVDSSQSLQIHDSGDSKPRGERLKERLAADSAWNTRLGQDFDVRRYTFDARLRHVDDFTTFKFDGASSNLHASLQGLAMRFRGRPTAGVLLFTDGVATDAFEADFDAAGLPPIFPVVVGKDAPARDIAVSQLAATQTNFEDAPVTLKADIISSGYGGQKVAVDLIDADGKQVERQLVQAPSGDKPTAVRFRFRPPAAGVSFYSVRVAAESELGQFNDPSSSRESTLANNTRQVAIDRGGGPFRILYVAGRPNWEYKFMRRALESDQQIQFVGMIRIARREPKFVWRSRAGESSNPLFRGFDNQQDEETQQYDQPVIVRLDTRDQAELRDGFPKTADTLFDYSAVILDDVEAGFFTQDQMLLLQKFVSQRGGGLLMLGGQESFREGGYLRTPIGEALPVYLDGQAPRGVATQYRLELTRDGWLQPWVRLYGNEPAERRRLDAMPEFQTLNSASRIKPGASVLARVNTPDGESTPALVAQRFGKGRTAALLVGDLWRWGLRREDPEQRDLEKAWRQTLRWLVADVPARVEASPQQNSGAANETQLQIRARNAEFLPLDNATVKVTIRGADEPPLELTAQPSDEEPGLYTVSYTPRHAGAYHARAQVTAPDGSPVASVESGWVADPAAAEFQTLRPNLGLLERLAKETGGELVDADGLDAFVASLPNRKTPVTERRIFPLWHQPWLFVFALACLIGEWGIRRWKGLA